MMARHEAGGTTAHPEYQAAVTLLMYRHMCRLDTWPPGLRRSMETIGQAPFSLMFGPHFFNCTGSLRDYSRNDRLGEVSVPTLLVQGEHDYVIPDLAATAGTLIPGAVVKLIRNCSHMPFYEDPAAYFAAVVPFLQQH